MRLRLVVTALIIGVITMHAVPMLGMLVTPAHSSATEHAAPVAMHGAVDTAPELPAAGLSPDAHQSTTHGPSGDSGQGEHGISHLLHLCLAVLSVVLALLAMAAVLLRHPVIRDVRALFVAVVRRTRPPQPPLLAVLCVSRT